MKVLFALVPLAALLAGFSSANLVLDLKHPEKVSGQYHDYDHLGLKVGIFRPSYNTKVTSIKFDSQGIWKAADDGVQHLLELVVFYKCMGIGLAHVTFYAGFNDKRKVLLGYSHSSSDMAPVTDEAFYKKLLSYAKPAEPKHPELPAHDVFFKLNKLLSGEEELGEAPKVEAPAGEDVSDEL
ncbi:signal peptide containing protein [Theileria equi strain WA]|uniref:Signal peptide containing protein n=1 Tax=Theileria equi strain WA TaxID=1537102 RepID=L1LAQ2_THEEQ|nr:signal peptide containing protein [Theileria equi strain WA]EKX72401.1 signal peptide containing protein [Theileria equi strain WA]|eukprot:XP_004831853.1 signal peptide containing protein [Theileria equi strain WA]